MFKEPEGKEKETEGQEPEETNRKQVVIPKASALSYQQSPSVNGHNNTNPRNPSTVDKERWPKRSVCNTFTSNSMS